MVAIGCPQITLVTYPSMSRRIKCPKFLRSVYPRGGCQYMLSYRVIALMELIFHWLILASFIKVLRIIRSLDCFPHALITEEPVVAGLWMCSFVLPVW